MNETVISEATQTTQAPPAVAAAEGGVFEDEHTPRPALTLRQAAAVLGKSMRAIERSILGRWGNRLPEGWTARRIETESGAEWRILPPPGFRLNLNQAPGKQTPLEALVDVSDELVSRLFQDKRALPVHSERHFTEQPAIIIDRADEVEQLLRELLQTQRQLSEERRLRMEDLRAITQMQGSMRLLEDRAAQTSALKQELTAAQQELVQLKQQYLELLNRPWWKKLFTPNV